MKQKFSRQWTSSDEGQWSLRHWKQTKWALWLHCLLPWESFHTVTEGRTQVEPSSCTEKEALRSTKSLLGVFISGLISACLWGNYSILRKEPPGKNRGNSAWWEQGAGNSLFLPGSCKNLMIRGVQGRVQRRVLPH